MSARTGDWVVIEREPGDWVAVDGIDGSLREIPTALGISLWQRDDLWPAPLSSALEALQAGPSPPDRHYALDVELLDTRLRLLAENGEIAASIEADLGPLAPGLRRSADVLVRVAPGTAWSAAYHAIPGDRSGFQVRQRASAVWEDAAPSLPVVPPLGSPPFAGRFLALHAALLVAPGGAGVLVCGDQGTGKTSLALWASRLEGAAVATDELALLDLQSGLLYGVPIPFAVRSNREEGMRTPIPLARSGTVHTGAVRVHDIVILEACAEGSGPPEPVRSAKERFGCALPHLRWVGADPVRTVAGLTRLLEAAAVWRIKVSPGPALPDELTGRLRRLFD